MTRESSVGFFASVGPGALRLAAGTALHSLRSGDGSVKAAAAVALGHMEATSCAGDVASLLIDDLSYEASSDPSLALAAAGVERRLGVELRRPECGAAYSLALMGEKGASFSADVERCLSRGLIGSSSSSEASACMVRSLAKMGKCSSTFLSNVKALLAEQEAPLREAACYSLGELGKASGNTQHMELVAAHLQDSNGGVREAALTALEKMPNPGQAMYLNEVAQLLDDPVPLVRSAALRALGSIGAPDHIYAAQVCRRIFPEPDLEDDEEDEEANIRVRSVALEVLATMGDRGASFAEEIASQLQDHSATIRESALQALSKLVPEARLHLHKVEELRQDPSEAVRSAADACARALGALGAGAS
eukprot:TRINITY_DN14512_c6_g1_i1.p1 TRINITY_DN14512_c6_g1~~TRINITY_DN14512_c6_g1_i1.p1  ORF type:complete len:417 (-),score=108.50 TRINITY_DN14512_c6_g1_i1:56-1147(-)